MWNMFTTIFYIINFFNCPYILAFDFELYEKERNFELFLDFIMLCDIVTEFFTSRMHKGKKISKPRKIAIAYMKSTFIFDMLACLPGLITLENYPTFYHFKVFRYL